MPETNILAASVGGQVPFTWGEVDNFRDPNATRGHKPGSKLTPNWLFEDNSFVWKGQLAKERIVRRQKKYKQEYDHRWGAKPRDWKVGQRVFVKRPDNILNRYNKYYGPARIKDVKKNVVTMVDGRMWSMDRLVSYSEQNSGNKSTDGSNMQTNMPGVTQSDRIVRSPKWHRDYLMK